MPRLRPLTALPVLLVLAGAPASAATTLARDPATLRIGERVFVDDGSCPTGQLREVVGVSRKTGTPGVDRRSQCVPRRR